MRGYLDSQNDLGCDPVILRGAKVLGGVEILRCFENSPEAAFQAAESEFLIVSGCRQGARDVA